MEIKAVDVAKLRKMTGAGMMDCKKALVEAEGDFNRAQEIIREKGKLVAAKRADRETTEGAVKARVADGKGILVCLGCETDFVANGKDFIALTQSILDAAVANKCKSIEEVQALKLADGTVVSEAVTQRSGITGEKMELDGYMYLEGENIYTYNHQNINLLCTMVQLSKDNEEVGHQITMQVAAMKPIALDEASVPQEVKDSEFKVAVEKTKEEQVEKAVVSAINKAGINANLVDSEDHISSNIAKGWLTEEEAQKARDIRTKVAAEKAANLPEQMIQNIAKGRLAKFFKENCLVNQEFIQDSKMNVAEYVKSNDKELSIIDFKRFTLRAE